MPNLEFELRASAFTEIKAFADLHNWVVEWPNDNFDREVHTQFLKTALLGVRPSADNVKTGGGIYTWLLFVNIYVREGKGEQLQSQMIDLLRTAFPPTHEFVTPGKTYQITRPATVSPGVSSSGWYFIPVQFRIQTIA